MIAILLTPFYIIFNIYIVYRLICWLGACHRIFRKRLARGIVIGLYSFLVFSILIAFLLPPSGIQRGIKLVSNYWLGTLLYIILTVVTADVIRIILLRIKFGKGIFLSFSLMQYRRRVCDMRGDQLGRSKLPGSSPERNHRQACGMQEDRLKYSHTIFGNKGFVIGGALTAAVITVLTVTGIWGAAHIQVTDYEVDIPKSCGAMDSLEVVLVADLHLGYSIGCRHMESMVQKINALEPDLVVIAGDIFDNEYEALEDPDRLAGILRGINSSYGVYACYGNHDIDEKLLAGFTLGGRREEKVSDPRMDLFLEQAGITLLHEDGVLIDGAFYLYGRPDYKKPGRGIDTRMPPEEITAGMDLTKPVFVIDHEPKELQELADAGVDLDLCGHTHDGQMFPGNVLVSLMWENSCGYLQKDKMHNIVTSGIGVFGPNMRVGTKSEICHIRVNFTGKENAAAS